MDSKCLCCCHYFQDIVILCARDRDLGWWGATGGPEEGCNWLAMDHMPSSRCLLFLLAFGMCNPPDRLLISKPFHPSIQIHHMHSSESHSALTSLVYPPPSGVIWVVS